ncbi:hypothetical protein BT93_L1302 [Corymbia citriodora subsp. variegata]|uniref:ZF-HD dimerization-type domain-containing protein n=1 Tax=Corymbia citriodora subsp. variegata TaxID=360336 RepID=A0A8T0CN89_CORYI|nr:hypothetical protein BT93_L1302 [Corymbia citriodora subsp. variegata]
MMTQIHPMERERSTIPKTYFVSLRTLDQPKPRIDHLLQPSIPPSSPPSAEFPKTRTSTQAMPPPAANFRYRECLKNHAASLGRHAVDGCGEFMPSGDQGTPEFFRCAACLCHCSFHRKEIVAHDGGKPDYMVDFQHNHHNENSLSYGRIRHVAHSIPQHILEGIVSIFRCCFGEMNRMSFLSY